MISLALLRHRELEIISRESRGRPIIAFLSAAEQPAYHTVMQYDSTHLIVELYTHTHRFFSLLITGRKLCFPIKTDYCGIVRKFNDSIVGGHGSTVVGIQSIEGWA